MPPTQDPEGQSQKQTQVPEVRAGYRLRLGGPAMSEEASHHIAGMPGHVQAGQAARDLGVPNTGLSMRRIIRRLGAVPRGMPPGNLQNHSKPGAVPQGVPPDSKQNHPKLGSVLQAVTPNSWQNQSELGIVVQGLPHRTIGKIIQGRDLP